MYLRERCFCETFLLCLKINLIPIVQNNMMYRFDSEYTYAYDTDRKTVSACIPYVRHSPDAMALPPNP